MSLIYAKQVRYGYWSSSEGDWKWPPSVPNSLPNGIKRDSWDNNQEMMTEISQRQISLPKDFTWRSNERITGGATTPSHWPRLLPNGVPQDHKLPPNGILNWMQSDSTKWLPRSQRIFYRSCLPRCPREVNQEHTEAIIRMTFTEQRSTETLPNADPRDAGIRICNAAFREQKRSPIMVSMTTYVKLT